MRLRLGRAEPTHRVRRLVGADCHLPDRRSPFRRAQRYVNGGHVQLVCAWGGPQAWFCVGTETVWVCGYVADIARPLTEPAGRVGWPAWYDSVIKPAGMLTCLFRYRYDYIESWVKHGCCCGAVANLKQI